MKKIQKKEGINKIYEGINYSKEGSQNIYGNKKSAVNEKKEKEKKVKLLNEFEKEFMQQKREDDEVEE